MKNSALLNPTQMVLSPFTLNWFWNLLWFWFSKAAEDVNDLGTEQQQREPPQTGGAFGVAQEWAVMHSGFVWTLSPLHSILSPLVQL